MRAFGPVTVLLIALACVGIADADFAFFKAHRPTADSYIPAFRYKYNALERVRIFNYAEGRSRISLGRVVRPGAHLQVTAHGLEAGHCSIYDWNTAGTAWVDCYDGNGARASRQYLFLAIDGCGADDDLMSYAWLNDASSNNYRASPVYSFGKNGTFRVKRNAPGRYNVNLGPVVNEKSAILVSPYRSNKSCNVKSSEGGDVNVECRNSNNEFADSRSSVFVLKAGWPNASFVTTQNAAGIIRKSESYSSNGGFQEVTRTSPGRYTVRVGREARAGGHVQVVSVGSPASCRVLNFYGGIVKIACSDSNGWLDTRFVLLTLIA